MASYTSIPLEQPRSGRRSPTPILDEIVNPKQRRGRLLLSFWYEAKRDFKTTRWRLYGLGVLFIIWVLGLIACIVTFVVSDSGSFLTFDGPCLPDGSFGLYPTHYSLWSASGVFQITLGFGKFSFAEAKAIDVVWDIIIGRVGQGLLVFLTWKALTAYVTTTMENAPVTYNTFWTVFALNQPQWTGFFQMIRELFQKRGLPSKLAMIHVILSMAFIIAFPTIASAMTGYQQNTEAYVKDISGDYVPVASLKPIFFIIHDGYRVNRWRDFPVAFQSAKCPFFLDLFDSRSFFYGLDLFNECGCYFGNYPNVVQGSQGDPNVGHGYPYIVQGCQEVADVLLYFAEYVFPINASVNQPSDYTGTILKSPVLNISATYFARHGLPPLRDNSRVDMHLPVVWKLSDQTYDKTWVAEKGACQPTGTYRWGFSFVQLYVMICLLFIWTLGTYLMWLKARFTMCERGRSPTSVVGPYQAAIQLASSLHKELGDDPLAMTEKQLRHRIKKQLNGGHIEYHSIAFNSKKRSSLWKLFSRWLKREAWWVLAIVAAVTLLGTVWLAAVLSQGRRRSRGSRRNHVVTYLFGMCWAPFLILGVLLAVSIGTTLKSRLFILFCVLAVGSSLTIIVRFTAFP